MSRPILHICCSREPLRVTVTSLSKKLSEKKNAENIAKSTFWSGLFLSLLTNLKKDYLTIFDYREKLSAYFTRITQQF